MFLLFFVYKQRAFPFYAIATLDATGNITLQLVVQTRNRDFMVTAVEEHPKTTEVQIVSRGSNN